MCLCRTSKLKPPVCFSTWRRPSCARNLVSNSSGNCSSQALCKNAQFSRQKRLSGKMYEHSPDSNAHRSLLAFRSYLPQCMLSRLHCQILQIQVRKTVSLLLPRHLPEFAKVTRQICYELVVQMKDVQPRATFPTYHLFKTGTSDFETWSKTRSLLCHIVHCITLPTGLRSFHDYSAHTPFGRLRLLRT